MPRTPKSRDAGIYDDERERGPEEPHAAGAPEDTCDNEPGTSRFLGIVGPKKPGRSEEETDESVETGKGGSGVVGLESALSVTRESR